MRSPCRDLARASLTGTWHVAVGAGRRLPAEPTVRTHRAMVAESRSSHPSAVYRGQIDPRPVRLGERRAMDSKRLADEIQRALPWTSSTARCPAPFGSNSTATRLAPLGSNRQRDLARASLTGTWHVAVGAGRRRPAEPTVRSHAQWWPRAGRPIHRQFTEDKSTRVRFGSVSGARWIANGSPMKFSAPFRGLRPRLDARLPSGAIRSSDVHALVPLRSSRVLFPNCSRLDSPRQQCSGVHASASVSAAIGTA